MNKSMIIIAISAILALVSCGDDDANNSNINTSMIQDTRVGNIWVYNEFNTDFNGKIDTIQSTYEINRSFIYNDETIYIYNEILDTIGVAICDRKDGLYYFNRFNKTFGFVYKYPCDIGDTYIDGYGKNVEVISINEIIVINNKTYKTIHYKSKIARHSETHIIDEYIEPGIGLIKAISTWNNIGFERPLIRILELKSFTLGKK